MELTIDIDPGYMCWFESYANFQILPDDHEGEGDHLSIYYFPYEGYGPKTYLTGRENCEFTPIENPWIGEWETWFIPNSFGGACGYMVLLGVDEYWSGKGTFIVQRQYENMDNEIEEMESSSSLTSAVALLLAVIGICNL